MTAVAPAIDNLTLNTNMQHRLKEVDGGTLITFRHTALGLIPDEYREGLSRGWNAHARRRAAAGGIGVTRTREMETERWQFA
jgi:hypothetical protein